MGFSYLLIISRDSLKSLSYKDVYVLNKQENKVTLSRVDEVIK